WGALGMSSVSNQLSKSFALKASLAAIGSYFVGSEIHLYGLQAQSETGNQLSDTLKQIHSSLVGEGTQLGAKDGFALAQSTRTGSFLKNLGISEGDAWKSYSADPADYGVELLRQKLQVK
ncbi:MAG TPA: hypothetical protein PLV25_07860, partial [Opitutales bacterium]|nr:hypothetical protein [Opitutales bacterium]